MDTMNKAIVLFDGVCNFCNSTVQFVIRHDSKAYFHFASLQSETGQAILKQHQLPTDHFETFILLENGKIYQKSTAALRLARRLDGLWPALYGLVIVPRFIRDLFYSIVARNRYRWFGKKDECMLPTPEMRARLVE